LSFVYREGRAQAVVRGLLVLGPIASMAAEFKFTAIPDQDTTRLQQRFDKIADYLSEQLGFKVT